ncbi:MAG: isoprenoid biosynthesis glyoxalase ElbB [Nitrospirae bacterium]|nr:isoprenoid biosynthesis glyoxalase ElbB [Nitrospirota bacterium]
MAKVGVVLSGCGVQDGSEIHESVLTLYFLGKYGATPVIMAPNVEQAHVVNHLTGEVSKGERRNVLVESARIARGNIRDVRGIRAAEIDALIFPGGFGAAKNLCTFAFDGADCKVNEDVARLTMDTFSLGKPIGAICIAPAMMAKIFGDATPLELTIGSDKDTADAINAMGGHHLSCTASNIVVDSKHKVVSTPAYMTAGSIGEAADGIEKLVKAVLDLTRR